MGIGESLLVALFMMSVVFFTLILLYLLIQILSKFFGKFFTDTKPAPVKEDSASKEDPNLPVYGGSLRLSDVDEPTAAIIMAIVSDSSGIPLSELCFKSIRRLPDSGQPTE